MLQLHAQPNPPPISRELYFPLAPQAGAAELCTVSRQIVTIVTSGLSLSGAHGVACRFQWAQSPVL